MPRAELKARISADARRFNRTMAQVKQTALRVAQVIGTISITASFFAVKEALEFEKQLAEIGTLLGKGGAELDQMKKKVLGLSVALGQTTEALTGGLYAALSAGVPEDEAITFLETASKAATAGVTDTKTAVTALVGTMNAYGISADKADEVSDKFFSTIKRGVTTFPELSESMGQVVAIASAGGVSLNELMGAIVNLTKNAVKTPEAMTAINGAVVSLLKPNDTMIKQLERIGFASGTAAIAQLGLTGTMQELFRSTGNSEDAMARLVGKKQAMVFALNVIGKKAAGAELELEAMENTTGAMGRAFEIMAGTSKFAADKVKAQISALGVALGDLIIPNLEKPVQLLSDALSDKDTIDNLALLVNMAATLAGGFATAFGWATKLMEVLGTVIGFITGASGFFDDEINKRLEKAGRAASPSELKRLRDLRSISPGLTQGITGDTGRALLTQLARQAQAASQTPSGKIFAEMNRSLRNVDESTLVLRGATVG